MCVISAICIAIVEGNLIRRGEMAVVDLNVEIVSSRV
jgi:hypothetical protein